MFELLIFIFLTYFVIRKIKGKLGTDADKGSGADRNRKVSPQGKGGGPAYAKTGTKSAVFKTGQAAGEKRPEPVRVKTESAQKAPEDSVTEYLRQKALEDEKAHAQEARIEEMRLHHETGGRMPAMRHYDGDSIPKGMHIVRCRYCAAENLIRDGQKQSDFTCYFCREIL